MKKKKVSQRARRCNWEISHAAPVEGNVAVNAYSCKACETSRWRSVPAPVTSTDLGVRLFGHGKIFYEEHCKIAGMEPLSFDDIVRWVSESDSSFYVRADAALVFFGAYNEVAEIITSDTEAFLQNAKYNELVLAGTVLAALNNPVSTRFFSQARQIVSDPALKYLAAHRLAVTEVKRLKKVEQGEDTLDESLRNDLRSSAEYPLEYGLKLNLEALAQYIRGDLQEALFTLRQAKSILQEALKSACLSDVEKSMAARYVSQISINIAQIHVNSEAYDEAVLVLRNNLSIVSRYAPEFIAEALSELSAVLYYSGDYETSFRVGMSSFGYLFHLGNIKAIKVVRKIVSAALF